MFRPSPLLGVPGAELLPPAPRVEEGEVVPTTDRLTLPGVEPVDDEVVRPEGAPELSFGDLVTDEQEEVEKRAPDRATTAGVAGMSDLESLMARRERRAQQDKWLALAQFGMQLMSSTQPTLGGAIGEAGMSALTGLREAEADYEEDMLDYLALQQRQQALARGASTSGGLSSATINQAIDDTRARLNDLYAEARSYRRIADPTMPGETASIQDFTPPGLRSEIIRLEDQIRQLEAARLGGSQGGVAFDATSGGISSLSMGSPSQ